MVLSVNLRLCQVFISAGIQTRAISRAPDHLALTSVSVQGGRRAEHDMLTLGVYRLYVIVVFKQAQYFYHGDPCSIWQGSVFDFGD